MDGSTGRIVVRTNRLQALERLCKLAVTWARARKQVLHPDFCDEIMLPGEALKSALLVNRLVEQLAEEALRFDADHGRRGQRATIDQVIVHAHDMAKEMRR